MRNLLLTIWEFPQVLLAWVMWIFLGDKELVAFNDNTKAFKCSKMRGSISLGRYIFLSPYGANNPGTVSHEFAHTYQSLILGPLYLLVIGIPSLLWAWVCNDPCKYYMFYPEAWANKINNITLNEWCGLVDGEHKVDFHYIG